MKTKPKPVNNQVNMSLIAGGVIILVATLIITTSLIVQKPDQDIAMVDSTAVENNTVVVVPDDGDETSPDADAGSDALTDNDNSQRTDESTIIPRDSDNSDKEKPEEGTSHKEKENISDIIYDQVGGSTSHEMADIAGLDPGNQVLSSPVEEVRSLMPHGTPKIQLDMSKKMRSMDGATATSYFDYSYLDFNTEEYNLIEEKGFLAVSHNPLSTFSIDVDVASYANMRRFINSGTLPPVDAVRIEEMINYFNYDYPQPGKDHPFSINKELHKCPWNPEHLLLHIGLQGKEIKWANAPASNLVFLMDVSGSMRGPDRLDLVKTSFRMLVNQLRPSDRVAIVVYAGSSGLVLNSTPGNDKTTILGAIDRLQSGGSTAGAAGIHLAYQVAEENYIKGGNNRVILATDGDFNVGTSSTAELTRIIEEKREKGVFLSVLGVGRGNLRDAMMESIADKGNGNYSYLDNLMEAKKVLVKEMGGTLYTIAKDVKIQVEFNPAEVKAYRLIGYENRALADKDFNDDKKDAGELGAGHTVTALYEIIPAGSDEAVPVPDDLKYQDTKINRDAKKNGELLTLKLRYKEPDGTKSKLIKTTVLAEYDNESTPSNNFNWSAAVAQFGMILRDSEYKADASYDKTAALAKAAKGEDEDGYRSEFINLVEMASLLSTEIADRD